MKVICSGYTIDVDIISELKELLEAIKENNFNIEENSELNRKIRELLNRDNLTPETIAAAYARISRNPLPVNELRRISREEVEKARKSNRTIIFEYGHGSIAEHAVFNFDIIGVSRLLVEYIQSHRLCSFTEKSQRYILFKKDYVIPEEIRDSSFLDDYIELMEAQNKLYHLLYERIEPYFRKKHSELSETAVENLAKEDSRYVVSLATGTQLGATVNARNIEYILRKAYSSPLGEYREFADSVYSEVSRIAPSLLLFHRERDYAEKVKEAIHPFISEVDVSAGKNFREEGEDVVMVNYPEEGDDYLAGFLLSSFLGHSLEESKEKVKSLSAEHKRNLFRHIFRNLNCFDPLLREFELVDFIFEIVLSASCFAQLKRHRMATIISQDYSPDLGNTVPESVKAVGMERDFNNVIDRTNELFYKLHKNSLYAAPYVLTNSHRRRVHLKVNARELYHISRLREDMTAQWDIRERATKMMSLAREKAPLTMMLACGKDAFDELYEKRIME